LKEAAAGSAKGREDERWFGAVFFFRGLNISKRSSLSKDLEYFRGQSKDALQSVFALIFRPNTHRGKAPMSIVSIGFAFKD
jgi:hypothetical protein